MNTNEEWRAVVGYEGAYEVSDQGRVRSIDRLIRHNVTSMRLQRGRVMKLWTGDVYVKVNLKHHGKGLTVNVHSIVATAFIGPRPGGMEICHENGDGHDNRLVNLRYDSRSANSMDQVLHGTHRHARRSHCKYGHEYNAENTTYRSDGSRFCKPCQRRRNRENAAKRLEKETASA